VEKKDVVNLLKYSTYKIAESSGKIDIYVQFLKMEIVVGKYKLINLFKTIK